MTTADLVANASLVLVGAALFLLPGYAIRQLLIILAGNTQATLGAPDGALGAILDSTGLSLAAWPLIFLYGSIIGVEFNSTTILAILIGSALIGAAVLLWSLLRMRRWTGGPMTRLGLGGSVALAFWPLLALTAFAVVLRFIAVHYLRVPLFGDSLHHTIITELFLQQGEVPTTYRPYADADSFTYHFGFHALAAVWAWATGQTSWSAVISVGQILNALAVPAAYVLSRELFRSRLAGLFSAVVVGFLSGTPTVYVNWGRYTQLAGQILLPFVIAWFLRAVETRGADKTWHERVARFAPSVIGATGLGLTHYRILIFFALFVLGYGAVRLVATLWTVGRSRRSIRASKLQTQHWFDLFARMVAVGVLGGLLYLPWLGNLVSLYFPGLFNRLSTATPDYLANYNDPTSLFSWLGTFMPLLAALGLLLLLGGPIRARLMAITVVLWSGLLLLSTDPSRVGLPGSGAVGTLTVGIALYIPLGALAGPAFGRVAELLLLKLRSVRLPAARLALGVATTPLLLALVLTALNPGARTTNQTSAYLTPDDDKMMVWIKEYTPPDSLIVISAIKSYNGNAITSSDGGMWIPLLTGRQVTIPPLSVGSEGGKAADLAERTDRLYNASLQPTTPESIAVFKSAGVGYIYIGAQEITSSVAEQADLSQRHMRRLADLQADKMQYELVMHEGDAWLFALK